MRKTLYYATLFATLFVLWIVIVLVLALLILTTGLLPMPSDCGFSDQLGSACARPQLWVMAIGIVLLFRPFVWKLITRDRKQFKKSTAIIVLVVGIVWLSINIGTSMMKDYATEKTNEQYKD